MASTDMNTPAASPLRGRIATMIETLRGRWEQYRLFRQTLTELQSLSNRELADLGLNRSMLHSIAVEAAYGK